MARKIFISFLGTTNYTVCNYFTENNESEKVENVKYVQEAAIRLYCKDFTKKDRYYFFLTQDAEQKNWQDDGHLDREKKPIPNEGLKTRLQKSGLKDEIKAVGIEEGFTTDQIWKIFNAVYECIQPNDEVVFDITHAFRSLPMLGMVLINYAKTLKTIKIREIHYGAFEKLGPAWLVEKLPVEQRNAPILDLRAFAELQDWTTAAQAFLNGGNTNLLKNLIAQTNPQLAEDLNTFALSILMCRGQQLNRDLDVDNLKNQIINLQSQTIQAQLRPLLEQIQQKLQSFSSQNTFNGIQAVEWCVANGLIQQGYTFLQETLKSHVVEYVFAGNPNLQAMILQYELREAASYALNGSNPSAIMNKLPISMLDRSTKAQALKDFVDSVGLALHYRKLTGSRGLRNDINHCGFKLNYAQSADLVSELNDLLTNVKTCLSIT